MPQPGFHEAIRALTKEFGALLIFDEVKTGFRFARGGAAEFFGVTPDLATYAKAMGNGYPAAAFGGTDEVMSVLPDHVSHGGTYAGNRVAAAAAVKTLSIIKDTDALEKIHALGRRIQGGLAEVLNEKSLPHTFTGHPSMFGIYFAETGPDRVPRLGHVRSRPLRRDRDQHGRPRRDARARLARAVVPVRGAHERRLRGPDRVDLQRLARRRSRGPGPRQAGRTELRRRVVVGGRLGAGGEGQGDGARRERGQVGRSSGRPAAGARGRPGRGGVTELARRLGLHKSTASRLLATLQKRGLVEQDEETGKYRLGLVVIRLAERAERTLDLRGISMPELERLARLTHETTGLGVLDGDSLLTVAQADGPNLIAVGDWTGRATPLHCVASGKVLLAALAEREVLRIVRRGLVSHTERTITELEPLLEELARIRRRGYATAIGEYELGLNAVSAPVHDARGNVVAAVDIWGPAFRLTPRRIPELAVQAREAAAAISVRLGGPGPAQGKSVTNGAAAPVTPLPTGVAAASWPTRR